jgi:hypothetical protein
MKQDLRVQKSCLMLLKRWHVYYVMTFWSKTIYLASLICCLATLCPFDYFFIILGICLVILCIYMNHQWCSAEHRIDQWDQQCHAQGRLRCTWERQNQHDVVTLLVAQESLSYIQKRQYKQASLLRRVPWVHLSLLMILGVLCQPWLYMQALYTHHSINRTHHVASMSHKDYGIQDRKNKKSNSLKDHRTYEDAQSTKDSMKSDLTIQQNPSETSQPHKEEISSHQVDTFKSSKNNHTQLSSTTDSRSIKSDSIESKPANPKPANPKPANPKPANPKPDAPKTPSVKTSLTPKIKPKINQSNTKSSATKISYKQAQKGTIMSAGQAWNKTENQWWDLHKMLVRKESKSNRKNVSTLDTNPSQKMTSRFIKKIKPNNAELLTAPKLAPLNLKRFPSRYKTILTQWQKLKNK